MLNNAAYEEDWYLSRPHLMKAELDSLKLCELAAEVGGDDVLEALDDSPLPDEPFDWTGIAEDIAPRVREVLAMVDRCCDDLLDVEYRTACRRLLARAAVGDPKVFRRKAKSRHGSGRHRVDHRYGEQHLRWARAPDVAPAAWSTTSA